MKWEKRHSLVTPVCKIVAIMYPHSIAQNCFFFQLATLYAQTDDTVWILLQDENNKSNEKKAIYGKTFQLIWKLI